MFRITLGLKDVRRLVMNQFGYTEDDLVGVEVALVNEFGTPYIVLTDKNKAVGPMAEESET